MEEMSVPMKDNHFDKVKKRIVEEIGNYLNKKTLTDQEMAEKIGGIGRSTFTSWKNGDLIPKIDNIYKLAKVLGVNPAYLMGLSDDKYNEDENKVLKDLISKNGLIRLKNLQESFDLYNQELNEYFIFKDIDYADIIGFVISDERFWRTLMHEAKRITELQQSEPYQNKYELIINKDDSIDNPTRLDYIDLVHQVNAKAINTVFDKYIEIKHKEIGITEQEFEERVPSSILNIKNKNIINEFEDKKFINNSYPIGSIITLYKDAEIPEHLKEHAKWKYLKTVGSNKYYERINDDEEVADN